MSEDMYGDKIIEVDVNEFPSNEELEGPEPDADFLKSVETFNIIIPVIATRINGKIALVDGRRRLKAARKLEHPKIKAIVYDNLSLDDTATWALILNEQRSANIITEYQYYSQLMKNKHWVEMQKEYGFNKAHVEKIMTLGKIKEIDQLVSAYESGKISENTLFEIAKLGESRQKYVITLYKTKGKLSLSDIKEIQKIQHAEAVGTMPKFDEVSEIPETEMPQALQFAVLFPTSLSTAELFADIQDAYEAKGKVNGARMFRLVEV